MLYTDNSIGTTISNNGGKVSQVRKVFVIMRGTEEFWCTRRGGWDTDFRRARLYGRRCDASNSLGTYLRNQGAVIREAAITLGDV